MSDKITAVIVGIGGYGAKITNNILMNCDSYGLKLVGVVDPNYENSPYINEIRYRAIPCFKSLDDFYNEKQAELAFICTPIYLHEEHCITALKNGSHILCEKPAAATVSQLDRMIAASELYGKKVNIGFQLCYIPSLLKLKEEIIRGKFGKPISLSALVCWPRDSKYYARPWCGKIKYNDKPVFDSIAMNACAHYLQIMFFMLGKSKNDAACPNSIKALLCRANTIETFDTAMLEADVNGTPVRFLASHTTCMKRDPLLKFCFEKATVYIDVYAEKSAVRVEYKNGDIKHYNSIMPSFYNKIPFSCDVVLGKREPVCTLETARSHLVCINALTESVPVFEIKDSVIKDDVIIVEGLYELLTSSFDENKMPWEFTDKYGMPYGVDLTNYGGAGERK